VAANHNPPKVTLRPGNSTSAETGGEKANCVPKTPLPTHPAVKLTAHIIVIYKIIVMA
jgi:hypothetical protein